MRIQHLFLLASVLVLPMGAHAQWQWIDKDNKNVFSDQAPPTDIPDKNILRRPGAPQPRVSFTPTAPAADAAPTAAAAPAAAARPNGKPTGVDKELEEKARKAEEAEKAKKAAETQKLAQAKAENCNRARQGKATMDSGIRVASINDKGEREVMDDKARAAEQQRLQSIIESSCQ
jgi:hypothetical protein